MKIKIIIPQYIRKVKISEKQRNRYYEFDSKQEIIKAYNKVIPDKYLNENGLKHKKLVNKIKPEDLKDDYHIGVYCNNQLIGLFGSDNKIYYFNNTNKRKGVTGYYLTYNNSPVLANPKKAGQPRYITINGQSIYSGQLREHTRGIIMDAIKESFAPYLQNLKYINEYPLRVKLYIYDTVKNSLDSNKDENSIGLRWDIGNRAYPYGKAFLDLLANGGKYKGIVVNKIIEDDDRLHITDDPQGAVFCPISNSDNRKLVFLIVSDDDNYFENIKEEEAERAWLIKNNIYFKNLKNNGNKFSNNEDELW